ncbi:hypothetical protein IKM56_02830 [Candidatus Saccharibacteria bacterium]|nr:hypothetical protein [Candidatus Saccharibacteria bacterium]
MENVKKDEAKTNLELARALTDFAGALEDYIDSCAFAAPDLGLCHRTGQVIYSTQSFVKVYEKDMPHRNTDELWPVKIVQVRTAFSAYSSFINMPSEREIAKVNMMLDKLIAAWRECDAGNAFAEEIDDAFGLVFTSEEITKNGQKKYIDEGFNPADIEGDVILLYNSIMATLSGHLVEIAGGYQEIIDEAKAKLADAEE